MTFSNDRQINKNADAAKGVDPKTNEHRIWVIDAQSGSKYISIECYLSNQSPE